MNRKTTTTAITSGQTQPTKQISCCLCAGSVNHEYEDTYNEKLRWAVLLESTLPRELVSAGSNGNGHFKNQSTFISNAKLSNHKEASRSRDAPDTTRSTYARKGISKLSVSNNLSIWKSMIQRLKKISSSAATGRTIKALLENFTVQDMLTEQSQLEIFGQKLISQRPHNSLNDSTILYDTNWHLSSQSTQLSAISAYLVKILIEAWKTEMGLNRNYQRASSVFPCFSDSQKRELVHKTKSKMRSLAVRLFKKALLNRS